MPACTALGVKSRTSETLRSRRGEPLAPQAASRTTASRANRLNAGRPGMRGATVQWRGRMRRRVTFSRNLTLSLSRTCRCYCKYCAFATHRPHLYAPDEVERMLDQAARRNVKERLVETVHAGSPTKHPARRLETIHAAGELRIPFTSGILVGIGETEDERVASLEALAAAHRRHGHIQEGILQNFVPHQSYYGREPARIADR